MHIKSAQSVHDKRYSIQSMALKRVPLNLTPAQLRRLDKLAEKLGLDRTNTLRYCLSRVADMEGIAQEKRG
jgi:hypothetical protein